MSTDLVGELPAAGALPAGHAPAFRAAPRERFVPDRIWYRHEDADIAVDRTAEPEHWLSAVDSDRALVTQFDDGATAWPQVGRVPTSSASMPSVVAGMLRALEPAPGRAVLEVGTGTGWNAALLAELVGPSGHVSTVEIDPAAAARAAALLGGFPQVSVLSGDAAEELPGGRFDRLIATAGLRRLPHSWVQRVVPGGVIVAPMRADMASGPLVRFVVGADGVARGRAVPDLQVAFMDLRAQRTPALDLRGLRWDDESADRSHTDLAPWVPLLADDHRWPVAVALPGCRSQVWPATGQRPGVAWLVDPGSGSWASVVADGSRYAVRQSGPRRLWDLAESAYREWQARGAPPMSAWEWVVTPQQQTVRLPGE